MADTLDFTCPADGCGQVNTITAPASHDDWDPVHERDTSQPGRVNKVVGRRLVIRCTSCQERFEHREDVVV